MNGGNKYLLHLEPAKYGSECLISRFYSSLLIHVNSKKYCKVVWEPPGIKRSKP